MNKTERAKWIEVLDCVVERGEWRLFLGNLHGSYTSVRASARLSIVALAPLYWYVELGALSAIGQPSWMEISVWRWSRLGRALSELRSRLESKRPEPPTADEVLAQVRAGKE